MPNSLKIRTLAESDLSFADAIRASAGWNQTVADWRRLLWHGPEGCFLGEWDGAPAGVVTTIRYGDDLAWIGMMLVHSDFRRRGIASALMEAAIDYLRSKNIACIKLDATPDGAHVYERLGFRPELELFRWEGNLKFNGESLEQNTLGLPFDFDRQAFGADRSEWIGSLAKDAKQMQLMRDDAGRPVALGMVREGARAKYLGPISSENELAGREVTQFLIEKIDGHAFWDLPEENSDAVSMAASYGFSRSRPLLRMWMGDHLVKGDPSLQYGIGDPSTG